jgi:glycosyltransferase involved in cell wall biosynthesis
MDKFITVGIPAFNAESHISDCLSSIMIQSIKDEVSIIIASDNPENNYDFVKKRFPSLDITILSCEKNTGPGLARQRALDACETPWITFIDADDIFFNPFYLEALKNAIIPNCIEVQGAFLQEIKEGNINLLERQQIMQSGGNVPPRFLTRSDVSHPWVFGRLYNVKFLRDSGIRFGELRAIN